MKRLAVCILTCDRLDLFCETLDDVRCTQIPEDWQMDITVADNSLVDETRGEISWLCSQGRFHTLLSFESNLGIASALNVAYYSMLAPRPFLGVEAPDYLAFVQDDVRLEPDWFLEALAVLSAPQAEYPVVLISGYNSPLHETIEEITIAGRRVKIQKHLPGVHLVAAAGFWAGVMPIQTPEHHTGEDWWITKYSLSAPCNTWRRCGVLAGLVRHVGAGRSTWNKLTVPEYTDPVKEIL